jgi:hypothetical protein
VTTDPRAAMQEDLAPVLENIGWGMLAATRAKLANTSTTRDFLEIGLTLLQEDLLWHRGPDFDQGQRSRLFESLSRERILARAQELDTDQRKRLTVNMFRHRWERKDRYTEDLISYLFRPGFMERHFEEMAATARAAVADASLKELVESLAGAEVQFMLINPIISLQAIVQVALPNHQKVRHFIQAQYDFILPRWARLYEQISAIYGLRLRPDRNWLDVALLFNTAVEGVLLRARIDRAEPKLSNGEGVLAASILTMLPSLLEAPPGDLGTVRPR